MRLLAALAPAAVAFAACAALLLTAPVQAAAGPADGAFAWLEARSGDAGIAPALTEAQAAAGRPFTHLHLVPREATGTDALRPLHALALALGPGHADLGRLRDAALAAFRGGQFGEPALVNDDVWSLKALRAAGVPADDPRLAAAAAAVLRNGTAGGGAWSYLAGGAPEVDTTGMALEALAAAGRLDEATAAAAAAWVRSVRDEATGGWPLTAGGTPNCDSTVWGIRALRAAAAVAGGGVGPAEVPPEAWRFLASLQAADGSLAWVVGHLPNAYCTAEAAALWAEAGMGGRPGAGDGDATDSRAAPTASAMGAAGSAAAAAALRRRWHKP